MRLQSGNCTENVNPSFADGLSSRCYALISPGERGCGGLAARPEKPSWAAASQPPFSVPPGPRRDARRCGPHSCVSAGAPERRAQKPPPRPHAPFSPRLSPRGGSQAKAHWSTRPAGKQTVFGYGIRVPGFPGGAPGKGPPARSRDPGDAGPISSGPETPGGGRGISAPHSSLRTPRQTEEFGARPPVGSYRADTMEDSAAGHGAVWAPRPRCDLGGDDSARGGGQAMGRPGVWTPSRARQSLRGCRGLRAPALSREAEGAAWGGGQRGPASASPWPGIRAPAGPPRQPASSLQRTRRRSSLVLMVAVDKQWKILQKLLFELILLSFAERHRAPPLYVMPRMRGRDKGTAPHAC